MINYQVKYLKSMLLTRLFCSLKKIKQVTKNIHKNIKQMFKKRKLVLRTLVKCYKE